MMLVDRLLEEEKDAGARRDLLFRQVDDSYATIMRQAFFALFEKTAHKMISESCPVLCLRVRVWETSSAFAV
jgi:oligoendopeptidase F